MIGKSLDRLGYTIKNKNRINEKDVEAYNEIIDYVNDEKQRQVLRNDMFFKLAINILKQDIIKSGGNDKLAMKNLRDLCDCDLDDTLERFVVEVNQMEITNANGDIELENAMLEYPKWDETSLKEKLIDRLSEFLN